MPRLVKWLSPAPTKCDICGVAITNSFVDGATMAGPWACLCNGCHTAYGRGLGLGRGQRYKWQNEHGAFVKVEG